MSEQLKQKMKEGRERAKLARVENTPAPADLRAELDAFKSEVLDILKEGLTKRAVVVEDGLELDGGEQEVVIPKAQPATLPENYQAIFEEYFDPTDGFEAEMSYEGNISFTIIVPMKYSNTTEAWRTLYKSDRRTKVLKQGSLESDIKSWCSLVSRNLHYDKSLIKK